jgi:hypothetical protein
LFVDVTAEIAKEYFYRVFAQNESGKSEQSNEIGPVKVNFHRMVDELDDLSKAYSKDGIIEQIKFKEIYKVKEDNSRFAMNAGSSIVYEIPNSILSFKVFAFGRISVSSYARFRFSKYLVERIPKVESFPAYKNVYGFLIPFTITVKNFQ